MEQSWKFYAKLNQKKYRQKYNLFYIEGVRLCKEALFSNIEIEQVFLCESFLDNPFLKKFNQYFNQQSISVKILNIKNFGRLSNTKSPQGILFVLKIPSHPSLNMNQLKKEKFILFLEGVTDPGNIGTIIRTADWFGIDMIYTTVDSIDFYNPKVVRASMGSIFRINFIKTKDFPVVIQNLKKIGFTIVSTDLSDGVSLHETHIKPPIGLILGGEAHGVSSKLQELSNIRVMIPKYGKAESLNVAVATGILINAFIK